MKSVKETMSRDLIGIGWTERIGTAYLRMQRERVRHLPVHDEQGEWVGMLSDRDVQRAMISTVEKDTALGAMTETIEFDPEARVRDYMSWPLRTVEQGADLRTVARRMIDEKVSSLVVTEGQVAVGIVTSEDLHKVLIKLLGDPGATERWSLKKLMATARSETGENYLI